MGASKRNHSTRIAVGGAVIVALVLILGTVWMGRSAKEGTETAVHSVSLLYLEELAGRREQVVEDSLKSDINVIQTAVSLMTEDDLREAPVSFGEIRLRGQKRRRFHRRGNKPQTNPSFLSNSSTLASRSNITGLYGVGPTLRFLLTAAAGSTNSRV